MRYLMPMPVPQRWRRRVLALGSGDPTRIICSALIAQAFESVRYPILPKVTRTESRAARREMLEIRHSLALCAARFRHLALFRRGEADDRERLRVQEAALGRPAAAAASTRRRRRSRPARRRWCRRPRAAGAARRVDVIPGHSAGASRMRVTTGAACAAFRGMALPLRRLLHARTTRMLRQQSPDADVHAAVPRGAAEIDRAGASCC